LYREELIHHILAIIWVVVGVISGSEVEVVRQRGQLLPRSIAKGTPVRSAGFLWP
jgi:hypothetical protein